ncbi:hypothetical protein PAEPH01_0308 [Pancytospora epiphaga]|nr:hypothetical protein PAEPH01_0308 [Pancytospora epiphaga]
MFLMLFFTVLFATISHQTPAFSTITFLNPTLVKAPAGAYIIGSQAAFPPYYLVKNGRIHKTIQKFYECPYDIERGLRIYLDNGRYIRDVSIYGDFSAQYLGIVSAGILLSILFKLFK